MANGGTRYQLHLVQSLIDNSSGTVTETQPKIEESLDLHKSTLLPLRAVCAWWQRKVHPH